MPRTDAQRRYDAEYITRVRFTLNRRTEADVIEHLEKQPNKGAYIKQLIREDMAKGR